VAGDSQASKQNAFGVFSDTVTGVLFSLLHAFDDCGIKDSSKNLRVLWVRALLNYRGKIKDDVAMRLLPSSTRILVTSETGAKLLDPILKFAEWIQSRTEFIDESLDHFLSSPVCTDPDTKEKLECNIVLFGAGYDTRALRYRNKHGAKANFIEVDLPGVVEGKSKLYDKFLKENEPDWDPNRPVSTFVPFDLNTSGGPDPISLIETVRSVGGLKKDVPTFIVWEAVLFYVNEDAIRNIMQDLFDFAKGGNGDSERAETLLCFTDSLKPFVDVPFTNEAQKFFHENNMDLLQHRSRWGGAVHFALASSRNDITVTPSLAKNEKESKLPSHIGRHINAIVGGLINSYVPTANLNNKILKKPSVNNVWYAVAFPWQIDGYETPLDAVLRKKRHTSTEGEKPFATRLWGEPIIIYRDGQGELVAMADVCPHRSVPLSMGKVENGQVSCMYHGWTFGEKGHCTKIPTLNTIHDNRNEEDRAKSQKKFLSGVTESNQGSIRAVVEHQGLVYVWRGNVLEADLGLLPTRRTGDMETVPIDTVLDYSVDYSYIVENNLDSPHLLYLHDGSVPPVASIGMKQENLPRLKLSAFTDDCGMGHLGKFGTGRPKKIIRFDPPNVVRHGGVSGFEEEFHCVPIAPQRTRVLLRQHLPRGPILSTISSLPGVLPALTILVNNWNYQIALEDSNVMIGQASRIEDWGSPRMSIGGLGDDLIKRMWKWRSAALSNLSSENAELGKVEAGVPLDSPYFVQFSQNADVKPRSGIPTGTSFGDSPAIVNKIREDSRIRNIPLVSDNHEINSLTGNAVGSWGIKQDYIQETPAANFPPINYKQYARMLVFDQFMKNILKDNEKQSDKNIDSPPLVEAPLVVAPIE